MAPGRGLIREQGRNRHRPVQASSKGQQGLGRVGREMSRGQILGVSGRYRAWDLLGGGMWGTREGAHGATPGLVT